MDEIKSHLLDRQWSKTYTDLSPDVIDELQALVKTDPKYKRTVFQVSIHETISNGELYIKIEVKICNQIWFLKKMLTFG